MIKNNLSKEQIKFQESNEHIDTYNFNIFNKIDDKNFNTLVESFGEEKEEEKILLTKFLKDTPLSDLGEIKIDIYHIQKFIENKHDIPKDLEENIAKIYIKNLYKACLGKNPTILAKIKTVFEIKDENDIENKTFDFKSIKVSINKLGKKFKIYDEITVSNDEIFKLYQKDLNINSSLESQNISIQPTILNLILFEVKETINYVKSWENSTEQDMETTISPTKLTSKIFEKVKDPEIEKLTTQKGKLEELENLIFTKDIYKDKISLKKYIQGCEDAGIDPKSVSELKKLLLGTINEKKVKKFFYNEIEKTKRRIREKYIKNFENTGINKEFISIIKKLLQNNFNFSILEKEEQTILRKELIVNNINKDGNRRTKYVNFDTNAFYEFIENLYDFEQEKTTIKIDGIGDLNLKIKKETSKEPIKSFNDVENFKNMGIIQPITFTVNIDDNEKDIINDLESEGDNILRKNGIMETHMTKSGPISIGNGYELEICGKTITKQQLDELLDCDYDDTELNKRLEKLGLLDDLKDLVVSTKKEIFNPENIHYDYDENGVAQSNDKGYTPYGYKYCIFKEILKKLDVKITKRDLIFEGEDVDKLSQFFILTKLGEPHSTKELGKHKDKKLEELLKFNYGSDDERVLGGKDNGERYASNVFSRIEQDFEEFNPEDSEGEYGYDYGIIQDDTKEYAQKCRDSLNQEGKEAFKSKLGELASKIYDENLEREISDLIDDLEMSDDNESNQSDGENTGENTGENKDKTESKENEPEKTEEEKIQELRNKFEGDKDVTFSKGARLFVDLGDSKLPPLDKADMTKSYFSFEITDVSESTFTLKAIGGELESDLCGKTYTLPKTTDKLEAMLSGGSIFKMAPRSQNTGKELWESCVNNINKAKFFTKNGSPQLTAFGNTTDSVRFDGKKFVKTIINEGEKTGKEVEVKYFCRSESILDDSADNPKDYKQGEKIYKYEIKKIDTSKGTVKIASKFDGYDDKYEPIKYDYENEITFEQFILLIEGKKLKGYTENEQKEMETKYDIKDPMRLANKGRRNRVSIGSIINVFKNTSKAIQGKLDEKKKEQEEILQNQLFSQEGRDLYGKLGGLFGGLGLSSLENAFEESKYEFYTNRENRTRKQIEKWYKIFDSDPNYPELFKEHLKDILAGYNGDDDKNRYKFAAALLIMVKKEGPYPRDFTTYKDKGLWVQKLLGPEHQTRFLNFYAKKKNALEQEKDMGNQSGVRLAMQEELNKMEMQYIISVIDGRAPYGPGSNEFMLKSIRSTKFLGELETNLNGYFNKHEEEKGKMETFYAAEEQYLRTVSAGRFNKALPALERMCETAKTKGEVFRIKGYILSAMLTGIIKNNATAKTIKSFRGTCRSMGFAPGYWMRDIEQQDKVKILLDGITNGGFSKDTGFKQLDFSAGNLQDGKYVYIRKFGGYRNSHGQGILAKLENPSYKNNKDDKSVIDLANDNNQNSYIFKDIIKNSTTNEIDAMGKVNPIFSQESPFSATSNMIEQYLPNGGRYRPKDPEDISNCEDFRKSLNSHLQTGESNRDTTEFLFKKYFNRFNTLFDTNEQRTIVRSIQCIQKEKQLGHNKEAKFLLWYMFKGTLHDSSRGSFPSDFENVANKFVDFFFNNIQLIDKSIIKSTFSGNKEIIDSFDNPFKMINWSKYLEYNMTDTKSLYSTGKSNYTNSLSYYLNQNNLGEDDIINTRIAQIWKSIHTKCPVPDNKELKSSTAGDNFRIMDKKELNKLREQNASGLDDYDTPFDI